MKRFLHLIRHAKSSWADSSLSDHDRPLKNRGIKDCRLMAPPLIEHGCSFETVYCSSARRAQQTIEQINDCLPDRQLEWTIDQKLYNFSAAHLWNWIRLLPEDFTSPLLIGHNPAFTHFINQAANTSLLNLPTCGYARLTIPGSWQELREGEAHLDLLLSPKMFRR